MGQAGAARTLEARHAGSASRLLVGSLTGCSGTAGSSGGSTATPGSARRAVAFAVAAEGWISAGSAAPAPNPRLRSANPAGSASRRLATGWVRKTKTLTDPEGPRSASVEAAGVEPASAKGSHLVSTCVVRSSGSLPGGERATAPVASYLKSHLDRGSASRRPAQLIDVSETRLGRADQETGRVVTRPAPDQSWQL